MNVSGLCLYKKNTHFHTLDNPMSPGYKDMWRAKAILDAMTMNPVIVVQSTVSSS